MKQNDLLVAINSVRSRASKALRQGNGGLFSKLMFDLHELELLAPHFNIELIKNPFPQDILTPMMDNDEMWYIDPVTKNGTVYYDLPLLDC